MAINTIKLLEKLAITIDSQDGEHLGSGTILRIRKDYYVLTAAHCIFYDETLEVDSSTIKVNNKEYGQVHLANEIVLKPAIDDVFIRVSPNKDFKDFPEVFFTDDYFFPSLYF